MTIYDQDADPTMTLDEFRAALGFTPLDQGYTHAFTPGRHYRDGSRHRLLAGIMLGLLLGGLLAGTTYVAVHHTDSPAIVKLHTTTATTALPPPRPSWTVSPTTAPGQPVYNAQGQQVPAGTPGAVTADAAPPSTITVNGTTAPNPVMTKVPGVVYTAPAYFQAPQMGTLTGDHPGVVDPEGRTVSQYLQAMGLPSGTKVAVVGSVVVGYVP